MLGASLLHQSPIIQSVESHGAPALLLELLPERLDALPVDVAVRLADPRRAPVPAQHHQQQQQRAEKECQSTASFSSHSLLSVSNLLVFSRLRENAREQWGESRKADLLHGLVLPWEPKLDIVDEAKGRGLVLNIQVPAE